MLAPRTLPPEFQAWNRLWGAPYGFPRAGLTGTIRRWLGRYRPAVLGPFAFQPNNTTRHFEFPWVYHALRARPGQVIVEIGGSLAGMQYVLARDGATVLNVDPGKEAAGVGWDVDRSTQAWLNRAFGTNVQLIPTTLRRAELPAESADAIACVSTLEHIPEAELPEIATEVARILRPRGRLVLTVDLFPALAPFTRESTNSFGRNVDLWAFLQATGLDLISGDPSTYCGHPEFDPHRILSQLPDLLVGEYPALVQCAVLEKRPRAGAS